MERRAVLAGLASLGFCGDAPAGALTTDRPLIGATSGAAQYYDMAAFDTFRGLTGIAPDIFLAFGGVDDGWHGGALRKVFDRGATAMLTLALRGPDAIRRTARGEFDRTLGEVARGSRGVRTIVRPFHEMNGRFGESWSVPDPADYLAAWARLRRIWREAGNAAPFCWSPNIVLARNNTVPFEPYYPGDAQTDIVGLDGYRSKYGDLTFERLFGPSLARAMRLGRRPVLIAEVGSLLAERRAAWIGDMFAYLARMPYGRRIVGLNWWQRDASAITDRATGHAFAQGAAQWRAAWRRG